ncbi:MAG TPA: nucleoside triphosphate pyrophosphohydrolase [Candidatus Acidoferrales bacterium]|jgi:MazG family protein|nr:nucleoside triphosphate pyrophosphohydrolase [Candidatus Acidoferrales bacterium]
MAKRKKILVRKRGAARARRKAKKAPRSSRAKIRITARDRAAGKWFAKLVALQARLRGPGGCPWDHEQTHESLRRFLIEEAYEVLDAMQKPDSHEFASELGDLLLQVVFHSILAEETGAFTISDVIESVHTKMVRRHPHVFGDVSAKTSREVLKNWEEIKREERAENGETAEESILAGVPKSLPGLLEAYQLTRSAARIGFDWENLAGILEKLEEEKREIQSILPAQDGVAGQPSSPMSAELARRIEEEVGDLLFVGVNVARFLGVDPEIALKGANRKFKERFQWMEAAAARQGARLGDVPRARMEELWNESKTHEAAAKPR